MANSDEFRALAERIAALSAAQIRTSEFIKNTMNDDRSGENSPGVDKKVILKTPASPGPHIGPWKSTKPDSL